MALLDVRISLHCIVGWEPMLFCEPCSSSVHNGTVPGHSVTALLHQSVVMTLAIVVF